MYNCKILADSVSDRGHRLTTFEVTYPRIVLAEMLNHRMFSRNTSSSRAIPVQKQIAKVREDPFIPASFGKNEKGMVASTELDEHDAAFASQIWEDAIHEAVGYANELSNFEVHKQLANRVIEPYTWTTQIITATDWDNFFKLRTAKDAQPEIRTIAKMMQEAYDSHSSTLIPQITEPANFSYEWHLPLVSFEEMSDGRGWEFWKKVSIGRCARTSYLNHDGKRDPEADIALYDRLWESGHLSPFEHVARPFSDAEWRTIDAIMDEVTHAHIYNGFVRQLLHNMKYVGNLRGWVSARMEMEKKL